MYTELPLGQATEYHLPELRTSVYAQGEDFKAFMERPYVIRQVKDHFELITPKWTGIKAGWLISQNESFNVYQVDRYAVWAGLVPDNIKEEMDFAPKYDTLKLDGPYLTGAKGELEDAWTRYKGTLAYREEGKGIRVKPSQKFTLASMLVEDGIIPYLPKKVEAKNLWNSDITLRPYQDAILKKWLDLGALTVVLPYGAGKTYLAIKAIEAISGPTLIVVPGLSLIGQWKEMLQKHFVRLNSWTPPKVGEYSGNRWQEGDIIVASYVSAMNRLTERKWSLLIFDEAHHFPAKTYSSLGYIDTEYRLGLTGSPWREDGRSEMIYALSGLPEGQDWDSLVAAGYVKKPPIFLHVTDQKLQLLKRLLERLQGRILVYCDSVAIGQDASKFLGIPFVYGSDSMATRQSRLQNSQKLICSRIFDEGIDLPDLKYTIELDFLGSSRRQEAQRVGRLMHSAYDKGIEHHLLMSPDERESYSRRLFALLERGFDVKVIQE